MSYYARADAKAQWFQDNYPGSAMTPNAGVLHTTEGADWPSYAGGATAPNYTAKPNFGRKRLDWRVHFPDERSSRALRNEAGGVETNTLNVVQVELVGTCDPRTHADWTRKGIQHIYWPEAPDWALRDLAAFIVDMNERHGVKVQFASKFLAYPSSYGSSGGQRFTFAQWRNFYGWCGHQHVPENLHGDPGALDVAKLERFCNELLGLTDKPEVPVLLPNPEAKPKPPTRLENFHERYAKEGVIDLNILRRVKTRPKVLIALRALEAAVKKLPRR